MSGLWIPRGGQPPVFGALRPNDRDLVWHYVSGVMPEAQRNVLAVDNTGAHSTDRHVNLATGRRLGAGYSRMVCSNADGVATRLVTNASDYLAFDLARPVVSEFTVMLAMNAYDVNNWNDYWSLSRGTSAVVVGEARGDVHRGMALYCISGWGGYFASAWNVPDGASAADFPVFAWVFGTRAAAFYRNGSAWPLDGFSFATPAGISLDVFSVGCRYENGGRTRYQNMTLKWGSVWRRALTADEVRHYSYNPFDVVTR